MKSWILAAILVSLGSLFFAMLIANTGYMGNGYYATIEIQILVLIGTIIICTGLIVNALRRDN